ncbi:MAG: hypothetical protein KDD92_16230 [Caldilineaceae bacterium]|nr:hypothetical protein [Caldilineaceae bacterium]
MHAATFWFLYTRWPTSKKLNRLLAAACIEDGQRIIDRQDHSIGERWQAERPHLKPLPSHAFACCISRKLMLNGYGQVIFETNRYSVPADKACKQLTLRAYPFRIEILADNQIIALQACCYARKQDILDPLYYLLLLAQRPGAFDHAEPLRQWRTQWPPTYETLLSCLRQQVDTDSQAIRDFIQIQVIYSGYWWMTFRISAVMSFIFRSFFLKPTIIVQNLRYIQNDGKILSR